ncbi:hypothetical protein [Stenotrophomonas daejeonensis]|uniref:hypothetical protein n=1 Tax=Stenotrophomonas daejeonensis TaxID=659018 RepID=UPI000A6FAB72|nr:hypothetical protein [Stenotrophomonas daejeonensis]
MPKPIKRLPHSRSRQYQAAGRAVQTARWLGHVSAGEAGWGEVVAAGQADKLPEATLQEDEKLLTLYDMALTRSEEQ